MNFTGYNFIPSGQGVGQMFDSFSFPEDKSTFMPKLVTLMVKFKFDPSLDPNLRTRWSRAFNNLSNPNLICLWGPQIQLSTLKTTLNRVSE